MRIDFPFTNSPASFLSCTEDPLFAGKCLDKGALLLYPTETFFALGCKCGDYKAIENILKIKMRPRDKCLPLIAANLRQASACCNLSRAPAKLLDAFWPGPLTLVLPATGAFHPALLNEEGKIAIRISSSAFATSLARQSGEPIISSSANISGSPPASRVDGLDPGLLENINTLGVRTCALTLSPSRKEALPSTIVEPLFRGGKWLLRILRLGAISEEMLVRRNFTIIHQT